jgi:hypothetical protein
VERGPDLTNDPAIPFLYTGKVGSSGLLNVLLFDDFNDNQVDSRWLPSLNSGTMTRFETNQQFTLRGDWAGIPTVTGLDTWGGIMRDQPWQIENNQVLELSADVVSLNASNNFAMLECIQDSAAAYGFGIWSDELWLFKYDEGMILLTCQKHNLVWIRNLVLALTLTVSGEDVVLTGRVLDKANANRVLYTCSVVDTPASDPGPVGTPPHHPRFPLLNDPAKAPLKSGSRILVGLAQESDGTTLPAEAKFDNVVLQASEVGRLSIDKAVRVSWPTSDFPLSVEVAPSSQGPWKPVLEVVNESGGVKQVTIPVTSYEEMPFFRLK